MPAGAAVFPWKTIFIFSGGNCHFGLPGGVCKPGTLVGWWQLEHFAAYMPVPSWTADYIHRVYMTVITLQRCITRRMTVHTTRAHQHFVHFHKCFNGSNTVTSNFILICRDFLKNHFCSRMQKTSTTQKRSLTKPGLILKETGRGIYFLTSVP